MPTGAGEQAERNRLNRDADIKPCENGSWNVTASLDDVAGAEFCEIFGHFVQAEFDADWAEARERVGDQATMFDLRRTQSQRRADALVAMAKAAAACPPWSKRPLPTVNILIDQESFEAVLTGERIDPLRYRDVVCRTQSGHELNPTDVGAVGVGGSCPPGGVRRQGRGHRPGPQAAIVHRRVTRGGDAARHRCAPGSGCDPEGRMVPGRSLDQLESTRMHRAPEWRPAVPRHNLLKELGFRVCRDEHGHWHTYHPDGHEIL